MKPDEEEKMDETTIYEGYDDMFQGGVDFLINMLMANNLTNVYAVLPRVIVAVFRINTI